MVDALSGWMIPSCMGALAGSIHPRETPPSPAALWNRPNGLEAGRPPPAPFNGVLLRLHRDGKENTIPGPSIRNSRTLTVFRCSSGQPVIGVRYRASLCDKEEMLEFSRRNDA